MKIKLKPCPFCGELVKQPQLMKARKYKIYEIFCEECTCTMRNYDKKELIISWNKRVSNIKKA